MENKQNTNTQANPIVNDPNYLDPNSIAVQKAVKPVNYLPDRKLFIILMILFLITAVSGLILTNNNAQKYRNSIKSKQYLLPTQSAPR